MALAIKRFKTYVKLIAILAAIAFILLIVVMNRDNQANVWFFHSYEGINVLWLILVTAVSSILGWWGIRKIFRVIGDLRALQRQAESDRKLQEQRKLADELAERERRIDEKVRRSISGETDSKEQ
jgi:hypothetical protein